MERNIRLLALHNFLTDFVFFAPVAIIYFAQVTGSYALGMSVFAAAYVSAAVFEVPTGIWSDLIGRKKTIILGSISSILCVTFYAIGGSYAPLFIGALFQGLSRAFYSGNNDALLHDTLRSLGKTDDYHTYFGRTGAMFQVALALAAIVGSIMAARSFPLVMWASVIPQFCALLVACQMIEPSVRSKESTNIFAHFRQSFVQFRKNKKLQLLSIASMIKYSLGESVYFFRSAFVNTIWPLWAVGISNFISNVGAAASFYFSGRIINRLSAKTLLYIEVLFNRVVNLFALFFPSLLSPALMGTTSVLWGTGVVTTNMLLQKEFTEKQRATMSSLNSLFGNVGFGVAAVASGFIADRVGPTKTLIIIHLLLLSPLIFYRHIFKHEK